MAWIGLARNHLHMEAKSTTSGFVQYKQSHDLDHHQNGNFFTLFFLQFMPIFTATFITGSLMTTNKQTNTGQLGNNNYAVNVLFTAETSNPYVDREIFVCRNFNLLKFCQVNFSSHQQKLTPCIIQCWKHSVCLIFMNVGHWQNIFNDRNFPT